jgi:hypothetical protein
MVHYEHLFKMLERRIYAYESAGSHPQNSLAMKTAMSAASDLPLSNEGAGVVHKALSTALSDVGGMPDGHLR